MEQEILKKLEENAALLEAVYKSVERMRKFFMWTLIITVVVIVLPLIGLVLVIPQFLNSVTGSGL